MSGKSKNIGKHNARAAATEKVAKKYSLRAYSVLIVFLLIFILVWILPEAKMTDPWYSAVQKVDSARKVQNPTLSASLMEEGGRELKSLAAKFPKHARVQFFLGYYYFNVKNWDSAMHYFRRTVELDSGAILNPIAPEGQRFLVLSALNKSNAYLKENNLRLAYDALAPVRGISNSPDVFNQFGMICQAQGKLDSAFAFYEKALQINPGNKLAAQNITSILLERGNKAYSINDFDLALTYFIQADKINPSNMQVNYNLGLVLKKKGKLNESIPYFKNVLQADPSQKPAIINLISIYDALGNQSESAKYKNLLDALPK